MNEKRYNDLYRFLMRRYGQRVEKICLDGGFTCPNRDGTCGRGGCSFCGDAGSGEFSGHGDVAASVRAFFEAHDAEEKPKADRFIAYFQSFSGTYAPLEELRQKYDAATADSRVIVLSVGTRPDCVPPAVVDLLKSYKDRLDVWVELGLQTADDETARRFNRGYETCVFADAAKRLADAGIDVIAHIMVGLPGEGHVHIARTVDFLNAQPISGIKIHSLYVMRGTALERDYRAGLYEPITEETYLAELSYIIAHLRPDIVVHRVTGDCPHRLHVAPEWSQHKRPVLTAIARRLEADGVTEGCLYTERKEDDGTCIPV